MPRVHHSIWTVHNAQAPQNSFYANHKLFAMQSVLIGKTNIIFSLISHLDISVALTVQRKNK